jgi:hypothetical protein
MEIKVENINANIFDWERLRGKAIIDAYADASELQWPPGKPWPTKFTITGFMGECVMQLDPAGGTRDKQSYIGDFQGQVFRATVFND